MYLSLLVALNTIDDCAIHSDTEREKILSFSQNKTLASMINFDALFSRLTKKGSWISEEEWEGLANHPYVTHYIHPYTLACSSGHCSNYGNSATGVNLINYMVPQEQLISKSFMQKFLRSAYHPSFVLAAWSQSKHGRLFAAFPKNAFSGRASGDEYCADILREIERNKPVQCNLLPAEIFFSETATNHSQDYIKEETPGESTTTNMDVTTENEQQNEERFIPQFDSLRQTQKDALNEINNDLCEQDKYAIMHVKGHVSEMISRFVYSIPDEKYLDILNVMGECRQKSTQGNSDKDGHHGEDTAAAARTPSSAEVNHPPVEYSAAFMTRY